LTGCAWPAEHERAAMLWLRRKLAHPEPPGSASCDRICPSPVAGRLSGLRPVCDECAMAHGRGRRCPRQKRLWTCISSEIVGAAQRQPCFWHAPGMLLHFVSAHPSKLDRSRIGPGAHRSPASLRLPPCGRWRCMAIHVALGPPGVSQSAAMPLTAPLDCAIALLVLLARAAHLERHRSCSRRPPPIQSALRSLQRRRCMSATRVDGWTADIHCPADKNVSAALSGDAREG
jgi:hypothetical protein